MNKICYKNTNIPIMIDDVVMRKFGEETFSLSQIREREKLVFLLNPDLYDNYITYLIEDLIFVERANLYDPEELLS